MPQVEDSLYLCVLLSDPWYIASYIHVMPQHNHVHRAVYKSVKKIQLISFVFSLTNLRVCSVIKILCTLTCIHQHLGRSLMRM